MVAILNPDEFKKARKLLGLTQGELAIVLNRDPSTIRRYEMNSDQSTKTRVDPTVARAINWMVAGFRPPEWPKSKT
jgi:transcriptional regulator with XRE-family HTH domain